jgi:hypothetical protein
MATFKCLCWGSVLGIVSVRVCDKWSLGGMMVVPKCANGGGAAAIVAGPMVLMDKPSKHTKLKLV